MNESNSKSIDLLGIKPVGDAIKTATDSTFKGAAAFLGRICLPAAEEFGLLLKDRVNHWRAKNAAKIIQDAEAKVNKYTQGQVHAHPRLVFEAIDKGSWSDDDVIQEMWAGILASSCTKDGSDDSNVVFTAILSQLTGVQLRILNYAVGASPKFVSKTGLPYADIVKINFEKLTAITGINDVHRLDRELDHMRSLELIGQAFFGGGGFDTNSNLDAHICLSSLALHLYVRGQEFRESPVEFFKLTTKPEESKTVVSSKT